VRVLVDAGYAPRTLRKRMRAALRQIPDRLDAVVITHAHTDHSRYAEELARSFGARLIATKPTARARRLVAELLHPEIPIELGGLTIRPFALPHDCPQVALVFDDREHPVGLATDLGVVPGGLAEHLSGCEVVLLESNHDPALLASGPYPPDLKARVASSRGHLSNAQAGELLANLDPAPRTVVLMHLSETNNQPEIALATVRRALDGRSIQLLAAHQTNPLVVDTVARGQLDLEL